MTPLFLWFRAAALGFLVSWVVAPAMATGAPQAACDAPSAVTHAVRTIVAPDGTTRSATVTLPDELPREARSERHRVRYAIDVAACAQAPSAALWVFRMGAPYRVEDEAARALQLLNAHAPLGALPAQVYNGRIPALFGVRPGTREVTLELQTLPYLPSGLVDASVGPANALLTVQAEAMEQVVAHADAASEVVLVLGLIALVLWWQRRADRTLLWLALACGLWGLRGLLYFGHAVYLDPTAFEQFNPLNVLLASAALAMSVLTLIRQMTRRRALLVGGATLVCVLALALAQAAGRGAFAARGLSLASGFAMVGGVLVVVVLQRRAIKPGRAVLLVAALGGLVACAVHDLMVVGGALGPRSPSYVFWGFVAMLVGFSVMSGQYVVGTLNRAERSNEVLEQHVASKTHELEQSYAQLRESEREAARTQERERLLRDMHDGLGAQLMTALRGVERGALSQDQVAGALQDGLDELRLLMDSTDMGDYLPGALAAWRNRWDARLAATGVELHWHIDESVDDVQLPGEAAMQVLRILQEAATNIVKHSQAKHMEFDARVDASEGVRVLRISIADDGIGLPATGPRAGSRGLGNMRRRAETIGAQLKVADSAGVPGTRVTLDVPA